MPIPDEPSFDGLSLFGEAVLFPDRATPNPVDLQVSAYPGVNGLDITNLGGRGAVTSVAGTLVAATSDDLAVLEQAFRAYQQTAVPCVLVDDLGDAWPGVVLLNYRRTSRTMVDAAGFISVDYEASFLHTII